LDATKQVLELQETVYKGKVRPFGKTKGSLTRVPVAKVLAAELVAWRAQLEKEGRDASPDAFMFPGRFGGPMDSSNYRHRVLHKLAEELDLPKLTFQVIRRTIATLGKTKGHVKDIQGIMRHSKASTTTDVYMQSLEPEVRSAINSIYEELTADRTRGAAPLHSGAESQNPLLESADPVASSAKRPSQPNRNGVPAQAEPTKPKPVRGVILEFATRMRQSRGREVLLND